MARAARLRGQSRLPYLDVPHRDQHLPKETAAAPPRTLARRSARHPRCPTTPTRTDRRTGRPRPRPPPRHRRPSPRTAGPTRTPRVRRLLLRRDRPHTGHQHGGRPRPAPPGPRRADGGNASMGVTIDLRAERLDCGSGLADLIEQVATDRATERTTHQASCTYCQAALAEIALHWEPIRRHAAQPVPIPPGLLPAIVVRIHRLAGTGHYAVTQAERGVTRLATWALNRLVAHAAGQVGGVSDIT